MQRVDVGDAQRVRHQASRRRATARPHAHAHVARRRREVLRDEEVARVAHRLDHAQLKIQPLADGLRDHAVVAASGALVAQELQERVRPVVLARDREVRHEQLAHRQLQLALVRDLARGRERVVDQHLAFEHALAHAVEVGVLHLRLALEVELVVLEPHPVRVVQVLSGLQAQQHVLRLGVLLVDVVHVVGRDDRHAVLLRPALQHRVALPLLRDRVVLDLDVVVVPEDVEVVLEHLARLVLVLLEDRLQHLALQAARRRDEPLRVLAQLLAVDPRLVVVALRVGERGQLDEVAVPRHVLREQHLVVPRAVRFVRHPARREVELTPDDRLHACLARLDVKLRDAVQIPVIRYCKRRHLHLRRPRDELPDLRRAVQEAVLGVAVKVAELGHQQGGGRAARSMFSTRLARGGYPQEGGLVASRRGGRNSLWRQRRVPLQLRRSVLP